MSDPVHPEIGPELRKLAQVILDRLDPAVRAAAAMATESLTGASRCQQVWCPVCALAALVSGEQHPLLTVIAEHSVSLMNVVRAMAAEPGQRRPGDHRVPEPPQPAEDSEGSGAGTRYQPIPIVVEQTGPSE
ncbi:MAG: hypothetical protein WCH82_02730 [Mycobacteriaceae bacterium]